MDIRHRAGLIAFVALAFGTWGASTTALAHGSHGVIPPYASFHGRTYGEWSAEFWKWQFSMPVDRNPIFDTADCSEGQAGPVWFLGGTTSATEVGPGVILGRATRHCRVPVGTALFFPIVNVECSTVEGNGTTETDLRACANGFADFITEVSAKLDGVPLRDLSRHRVESPLFQFGPLPDDNVIEFFGFAAPAGTVSASVSDGVHVMLAPLSRGEHTLHFQGTIDLSSVGGPTFIQDITYHLSVGRRHR